MKSLFSTFLLSLCLFACNNATETEEKQSIEAKSEATTSEKTEDSAEEYPFPVYTTFEQIKPIFNYENDTTYVINFWATWCKPCVEELPYFETLHEKYKDEKVKVILVSLDFAKKLKTQLVPFVKERNLQSDVMVLLDADHNSWIDKVSPDWDGAIPVTMIYNKDKREFVSEQFEQYQDLEEVLEEVRS